MKKLIYNRKQQVKKMTFNKKMDFKEFKALLDKLWEYLGNADEFKKWLFSLSEKEQNELYGHPIEREFELLLKFPIPP